MFLINLLWACVDYFLKCFKECSKCCRPTRENVMKAHGRTHLFLVVVNQPKNITAISTTQPII